MSVQRGDVGFELGAATMNTILTFGALLVAGGVAIAVEYPNVSAVPLIVLLAAVAVVLPVLLYPFTNTLWFAMELLMDPPSAEAVAEAEQAVSSKSSIGA